MRQFPGPYARFAGQFQSFDPLVGNWNLPANRARAWNLHVNRVGGLKLLPHFLLLCLLFFFYVHCFYELSFQLSTQSSLELACCSANIQTEITVIYATALVFINADLRLGLWLGLVCFIFLVDCWFLWSLSYFLRVSSIHTLRSVNMQAWTTLSWPAWTTLYWPVWTTLN